MPKEIVIEYCAAWNYEPQAASLVDRLMKLKQRVGALKLVPSDGGVFEVSADGKVIHSKRATGEFPDPDDVLRAVQSLR